MITAASLIILAPAPGERHVDATFGAGGYTRALLAAGAEVIAFDRDPDAIAAGRALEAAEPLPFDGSGRFIMPAFERRYARIGGAAVFLGSFNWITIWAPALLLETTDVDPFIREFVEFTCEEKGIAL